jgi:hypothetical protein
MIRPEIEPDADMGNGGEQAVVSGFEAFEHFNISPIQNIFFIVPGSGGGEKTQRIL